MENEKPSAKQLPEWRTWKTIKIGTYPSKEALYLALLESHCYVNDWAITILAKSAFKLHPVKQDIELVKVSLKELGFNRKPRLPEILARGVEYGLYPCPSETAAQLRMQYMDQLAKEDCLQIVSDPIIDDEGHQSFFQIWRIPKNDSEFSDLNILSGAGFTSYPKRYYQLRKKAFVFCKSLK